MGIGHLLLWGDFVSLMRKPIKKRIGGVWMSSDDLLVYNINNEGKIFNFIVLKSPNLLL